MNIGLITIGDELLVKRYVLSKRERKSIVEELTSIYPGLNVDKDSVIEVAIFSNDLKFIVIDKTPAFFQYNGRWFPHLKYLWRNTIPGLPLIVVDKGAVKPILNGADLMAPGVRNVIGVFNKGDIVVVVDEEYSKPIMVGEALVDSNTLKNMSKGKVVRNIHVVNDNFWNAI